MKFNRDLGNRHAYKSSIIHGDLDVLEKQIKELEKQLAKARTDMFYAVGSIPKAYAKTVVSEFQTRLRDAKTDRDRLINELNRRNNVR